MDVLNTSMKMARLSHFLVLIDKYEKYCVRIGMEILKGYDDSRRKGEKRPSEERTPSESQETSRGSKSQRTEEKKEEKATPKAPPPPLPPSDTEPEDTGPAAACAMSPGLAARLKAKEEWEREPLTPEEMEQMRDEHRKLVARNVVEALQCMAVLPIGTGLVLSAIELRL